ncbi:MAG: hypothetical protein ACREQ9_03155, partial [Candidatus Binatia bacterium]
ADPSSYYWASLAYRRVRAFLAECRGGGAASDATRHSAIETLDRFKAIVLAVAITAERDVAFDRPWAPPLPLSIPGTRLTVLGASGTTLSGTRSASMVRGDASTVSIDECPAVNCGAHEIFLKPSGFDLPEFEFFAPLRDLPSGFQIEQADTLVEALAILERHSTAAFRDLGDIVRVIAFKPENFGDYTNVSHVELPGAFGRFSAAGAKLLASMNEEVERLRREVDRLNLPADLPFLLAARSGGFSEDADPDDGHVLTPREALLRHIDRYDVRGQCADIRASVAAGLPSRAPIAPS